jgi:hypothetical protein
MGFIKDRISQMREKEKRGEVVERELAPDPMAIQSDPENENLMSEIVSDKEEGDILGDSFDEGSKPEPERKETTDLSLTDLVEKEVPVVAKREVETKPAVESAGTDPKDAKPSDALPIHADDGARYKVKTVYGEEELTLKELEQGYMRAAHHTQVSQQNAEMRKQLTYLFSDPKNIVEYALANGVDLKPLVQADVAIPEFNIPEPGEYATETERVLYGALKQQSVMNRALLKEVTGIKNSSKLSKMGMEEDQVEREFKEKRGDVPETAAHAVRALFREGKRVFGAKYGMQNAIRDYKIAEGDVIERWKASPQFTKWYEAERRKIIGEYADGKDKTKAATLSPDSLPTGKRPVPPDETEKPHSMADARAMIKKRFFGGK